MTGVEMIAAERKRQVEEEGWSVERDVKLWTDGELEAASQAYIEHAMRQVRGTDYPEFKAVPTRWPWDRSWWKPSTDPRVNLKKGAALAAAAIDRLNALAETP